MNVPALLVTDTLHPPLPTLIITLHYTNFLRLSARSSAQAPFQLPFCTPSFPLFSIYKGAFSVIWAIRSPALKVAISHWFVTLIASSALPHSLHVLPYYVGPLLWTSWERHFSKFQTSNDCGPPAEWAVSQTCRAGVSVVDGGAHSGEWEWCAFEHKYVAACGPAWASHYDWARNLAWVPSLSRAITSLHV